MRFLKCVKDSVNTDLSGNPEAICKTKWFLGFLAYALIIMPAIGYLCEIYHIMPFLKGTQSITHYTYGISLVFGLIATMIVSAAFMGISVIVLSVSILFNELFLDILLTLKSVAKCMYNCGGIK